MNKEVEDKLAELDKEVELTEPKRHLEIEVKYNADNIDRMAFKEIARSLNPKKFLYVESTDVYYVKEGDEFLRYRMKAENSIEDSQAGRSELTFKKKHTKNNNIVRTEVNLRVDLNAPELIHAFVEGLGYKKNFSVLKRCDIFFYEKADIVFYSVKDESGKYANFLEIEIDEELDLTEEQSMDIIREYEKILEPIGITAQKRMKRSLFEIYVNR